eukprot:PhF_6_TR14874/c0_g1_i1/m.23185
MKPRFVTLALIATVTVLLGLSMGEVRGSCTRRFRNCGNVRGVVHSTPPTLTMQTAFRCWPRIDFSYSAKNAKSFFMSSQQRQKLTTGVMRALANVSKTTVLSTMVDQDYMRGLSAWIHRISNILPKSFDIKSSLLIIVFDNSSRLHVEELGFGRNCIDLRPSTPNAFYQMKIAFFGFIASLGLRHLHLEQDAAFLRPPPSAFLDPLFDLVCLSFQSLSLPNGLCNFGVYAVGPRMRDVFVLALQKWQQRMLRSVGFNATRGDDQRVVNEATVELVVGPDSHGDMPDMEKTLGSALELFDRWPRSEWAIANGFRWRLLPVSALGGGWNESGFQRASWYVGHLSSSMGSFEALQRHAPSSSLQVFHMVGQSPAVRRLLFLSFGFATVTPESLWSLRSDKTSMNKRNFIALASGLIYQNAETLIGLLIAAQQLHLRVVLPDVALPKDKWTDFCRSQTSSLLSSPACAFQFLNTKCCTVPFPLALNALQIIDHCSPDAVFQSMFPRSNLDKHNYLNITRVNRINTFHDFNEAVTNEQGAPRNITTTLTLLSDSAALAITRQHSNMSHSIREHCIKKHPDFKVHRK